MKKEDVFKKDMKNSNGIFKRFSITFTIEKELISNENESHLKKPKKEMWKRFGLEGGFGVVRTKKLNEWNE